MSIIGKFRNEDFSMYFLIKSLIGTKVKKVYDAYPFNELETKSLVVPSVAIEHESTGEHDGELGSSWFRRNWVITLFCERDTQRDELSDLVFTGLNLAVPIRDYSTGFNKDTGKSLLGADLRIIEYVVPTDRTFRPTYGFDSNIKILYWKSTITFTTISTSNE